MSGIKNSIPHDTIRFGANTSPESFRDVVAVEAPMQLKLQAEDLPPMDYAVLMRTPGEDRALITGLLFSESVIHREMDILNLTHAVQSDEIDAYLVRLRSHSMLRHLKERNITGHSACGVCSMDSAERLLSEVYPLLPLKEGIITATKLLEYRNYFTGGPSLFTETGGSHATIFLNESGELLLLCEDVGRHNAMDKAIGNMIINQALEQVKTALVSGRLSYEIVHKALKANIPVLAGLGAPSSMAIRLAQDNNLTLVGFLHRDRFNVYCHEARIRR